ncbi:hypothetical protein C8J57DRAFT_1523834 [Mycena rebaudengoi]|nr:hypothetical protein C8J57DRAFT_1523834 [Mycena rebaudengoi]
MPLCEPRWFAPPQFTNHTEHSENKKKYYYLVFHSDCRRTGIYGLMREAEEAERPGTLFPLTAVRTYEQAQLEWAAFCENNHDEKHGINSRVYGARQALSASTTGGSTRSSASAPSSARTSKRRKRKGSTTEVIPETESDDSTDKTAPAPQPAKMSLYASDSEAEAEGDSPAATPVRSGASSSPAKPAALRGLASKPTTSNRASPAKPAISTPSSPTKPSKPHIPARTSNPRLQSFTSPLAFKPKLEPIEDESASRAGRPNANTISPSISSASSISISDATATASGAEDGAPHPAPLATATTLADRIRTSNPMRMSTGGSPRDPRYGPEYNARAVYWNTPARQPVVPEPPAAEPVVEPMASKCLPPHLGSSSHRGVQASTSASASRSHGPSAASRQRGYFVNVETLEIYSNGATALQDMGNNGPVKPFPNEDLALQYVMATMEARVEKDKERGDQVMRDAADDMDESR